MPFDLTPFTQEHQLNNELDTIMEKRPRSNTTTPTLPGQPSIRLEDHHRLRTFLEKDLCTTDLDQMAPSLWMMSTQSHANVSPLHHQRVKGREIIVTEDPRLHLIWIHGQIFIKPLPAYLLSEQFWTTYLLVEHEVPDPQLQKIRRAALGYLRTFHYLIKHESDFHIARNDNLRLIPKETTWPQICDFTSDLLSITDDVVSPRYAYGEIRLTRLNLYAKFLLRKWNFEQIHGQYNAYFGRFYGPLLFIFAMLSVVLSSSQVVMAVEQLVYPIGKEWLHFWWFSRWFGILVIAVVLILGFGILLLLIAMIADEWVFAIRTLHRKKKTAREAKNEQVKLV